MFKSKESKKTVISLMAVYLCNNVGYLFDPFSIVRFIAIHKRLLSEQFKEKRRQRYVC